MKQLSDSLKKVAANESTFQLRDGLFRLSQKYDVLEKDIDIFRRCEEQSALILDEAKSGVITPLKVILIIILPLVIFNYY